MAIFGFINDQLLKMTWLSNLVKALVENVFGLDVSGRLGGSIHFFIYDVIKIFILLSALIFIVSHTSRASSRLRGRGRYSEGFQGSRRISWALFWGP